jgi:hypothetical protein
VHQRKGHSVAVGAVARHLDEATFWILTRNQIYQESVMKKVLPRQEEAREIYCILRREVQCNAGMEIVS